MCLLSDYKNVLNNVCKVLNHDTIYELKGLYELACKQFNKSQGYSLFYADHGKRHVDHLSKTFKQLVNEAESSFSFELTDSKPHFLFLLYSAIIFHDIGMATVHENYPDMEKFVKEFIALNNERKDHDEKSTKFIEDNKDKIIQHSKSFIQHFKIDKDVYINILKKVCKSHGEHYSVFLGKDLLNDNANSPFSDAVTSQRKNDLNNIIKYSSALLSLVDLLDVCPERFQHFNSDHLKYFPKETVVESFYHFLGHKVSCVEIIKNEITLNIATANEQPIIEKKIPIYKGPIQQIFIWYYHDNLQAILKEVLPNLKLKLNKFKNDELWQGIYSINEKIKDFHDLDPLNSSIWDICFTENSNPFPVRGGKSASEFDFAKVYFDKFGLLDKTLEANHSRITYDERIINLGIKDLEPTASVSNAILSAFYYIAQTFSFYKLVYAYPGSSMYINMRAGKSIRNTIAIIDENDDIDDFIAKYKNNKDNFIILFCDNQQPKILDLNAINYDNILMEYCNNAKVLTIIKPLLDSGMFENKKLVSQYVILLIFELATSKSHYNQDELLELLREKYNNFAHIVNSKFIIQNFNEVYEDTKCLIELEHDDNYKKSKSIIRNTIDKLLEKVNSNEKPGHIWLIHLIFWNTVHNVSCTGMYDLSSSLIVATLPLHINDSIIDFIFQPCSENSILQSKIYTSYCLCSKIIEMSINNTDGGIDPVLEKILLKLNSIFLDKDIDKDDDFFNYALLFQLSYHATYYLLRSDSKNIHILEQIPLLDLGKFEAITKILSDEDKFDAYSHVFYQLLSKLTTKNKSTIDIVNKSMAIDIVFYFSQRFQKPQLKISLENLNLENFYFEMCQYIHEDKDIPTPKKELFVWCKFRNAFHDVISFEPLDLQKIKKRNPVKDDIRERCLIYIDNCTNSDFI